MAQATEELRIVINAQDNASAVVKNVGNSIQGVLSNAVSGAAAGVGFAAFNQIAQTIADTFRFATDAVVGFNATLEQSRIAWATMLGGGQQAETMLKRIQTFAASTPFSFPDVERAARRFVAMGIAAEDVIPLMRSVGAAAIAIGGGTDAVDRISRALGQMSTRTKVSAEDMMQLTEVGIPAWKILADATGQSVAQIQDSVTKGKVSADVMIAAFQNFAEVNWAKLLDTQTFNTAISNIQDNVTQLIATAFKPLFDSLRDLAIQFEAFTKSADLQAFTASVQNAQVAIRVFLDTIAGSGPVLTILQGALGGLATVLGLNIVIAATRATAAMLPLIATFAAANAPLLAFLAIAAVAGVIVAANWDEITNATADMRTNVANLIGDLVTWIGGTALPELTAFWTKEWEGLWNTTAAALNTVGAVWNAFWAELIGAQAPAFAALNDVAAKAWSTFVEIETGALRAALNAWNSFIGALGEIRNAVPEGIPLGTIDLLVGKFVDADRVAGGFKETLNGLPQVVGEAFSAYGTFYHDILPTALGRAAELGQAAIGTLTGIPQRVMDELNKANLPAAGADVGAKVGTALGQGVVQAAKPLLEQLTRMLAQLAAGPATAALTDTQKAIERARLVIADITQPTEERQAAYRQIVDLSLNALPRQQLVAFDANEVVRRATEAEGTANLLQQIQQTRREMAGQSTGGIGGATAGGGIGAGPALAQPAVPPPTAIYLRLDVSTDGGEAVPIYQELIEANGQAQMPPIIQVSAVRRN